MTRIEELEREVELISKLVELYQTLNTLKQPVQTYQPYIYPYYPTISYSGGVCNPTDGPVLSNKITRTGGC
jgi:hypothetical protein